MWRITKQTTLAVRNSSRNLGQRNVSKSGPRLQQAGEATAPPPPPPLPSSSGKTGSGLKILGGGLLIAAGAIGGSIAYAKTNPEFRQQVENNWPILVPLTSYIFDDAVEEEPKSLGALSTPFGKKTEIPLVAEVKPKGTPPTPIPIPPPPIAEDSVKIKKEKAPVTSQKDKEKQELIRRQKEEAKAQKMEQKLLEQEIEEAAEITAMEAILGQVTESTINATATALHSQASTVEIIQSHTEKLKLALDNSEDISTEAKDKQWNDVIEATGTKETAQQKTDAYIYKAREEIEKLKTVVEEGTKMKSKKFGPSKLLIGAKESLIHLQTDLDEAEKTKANAEREGRMLKECHDLIEKNKEQFKKELASVVPQVKLGRKGAKLSEDELNAIIAYTHRRIEQLHRQLAEQQALEEKRIGLALEKQKEMDEQANHEEVLRQLERKRAEWAILQEKKLADLSKEYEDEMRVQLRRQSAAHSDHLSDVLGVQEKQHFAQLQNNEIETRQEERSRYQEKLNSAMAKLRGVEAAIEGRADLEKQNKKSQELWLACETLKQTISTGKLGGRNWEDKLKPLANEVIAIKEVAGEENKFVNTVVDKIPEEALLRGVFNEESLRERWEDIQRVCKRVALIDENGGSIFRYFVSYFQSLLVFTESVPPLEDEEIDVGSLDVFKLVSFTTYYVERGDLEQALRYANQLKGMSRKVAGDWLREVRLLLETSQVAGVLASQASATGLGGLHIQ